jgi:ATP-binding cassette subfamily B protein
VGVSEGRMTLGDLVLVNAFLIQLYMPLNFLGVLYREIRQALTDIERMFGLMGTACEVADRADARSLPRGAQTVAFAGVDFAYDPARPILHQVSFTIPAGQTLAVVGHSGSGKSTLARLLFRFYDVRGGEIRVGGADVRSYTQASLRGAIGIVPQDTVLFNDTLFYNIQYGRPEARREEVEAAARAAQLEDFIARLPDGWDTRVGERGLKLSEVESAARAAHIHDFIESLPDGYATLVGERGLKLSGGEKQRVAIARALLKNPDILIFDEATSALDSRTEKAIQAQLEAAARGRTTLIIAHRLSTIMNADQILVLDQGRVVEHGTHTALLAREGAYARMWALQQQEQES